MIYIQKYWQGTWPADNQQQYETDCEGILAKLKNEWPSAEQKPYQTGLYLASSNAGAMPATQFWKDALELGVRFASPKNFPWTLANAPCSYFARMLPVKGPNYTFCGMADAGFAALQQASDDLNDGLVENAWVFAIDFGLEPGSMGSFAVIYLSQQQSESAGTLHLPTDDPLTQLTPSAWLHEFVETQLV